MKNTNLTTYSYKPFTTPLTRCTMPDGTMEYRHTKNGKPVEVVTENLFDLISCSHEQIHTMVEMLPDEIYSQYAYIFKAVLQDVSATLAEAHHFIQEAGVEIDVAIIRKNHFLCREGAVVDAIVKGVKHAD